MWGFGLLWFIVLLCALRAFLIIVGVYKDPVLASFEKYGAEVIYSPLLNLVAWVGFFLYLSLFWLIQTEIVLGLGLLLLVPAAAFREHFRDTLIQRHEWFRVLPRWYYDLVLQTDREERRRIAYLWLYLPMRTRMLYNAHNDLFGQWVEQVLMTISR
jgi:hypothetical protein